MKKFSPLILAASLAVSASLLLAACGSSSTSPVTSTVTSPATVTSDIPVTIDSSVDNLGYKVTTNSVVFVFDTTKRAALLTSNKVTAITGISVRGSFNGWANPTPAAFQLKASATDKGVWYGEIPLASLKMPGNSGLPEFQFVVAGTVGGTASKEAYMGIPSTVPMGYWFNGNQLVVLPGDDVNAVINNVAIANTVKTINDFNLATAVGQEKVSNFRQVPGLTKLFRSYHPFKKSRTQYDTEDTRIALVNTLMEQKGVKSVITLYKDETGTLDATLKESISAYHQAIIAGGHNYYVPDADYNTVYYSSDAAKFGGWVKGIVAFINAPSNQAPFQIHCRLGTDRTGVFSAVLAALAGTSWADIAADYQRSNDMGIKEFRDYKILKYSFEHMLGVSDVTAVTDLKAAVSKHFIDGGYLTQADIDAMTAKLK